MNDRQFPIDTTRFVPNGANREKKIPVVIMAATKKFIFTVLAIRKEDP